LRVLRDCIRGIGAEMILSERRELGVARNHFITDGADEVADDAEKWFLQLISG
jgi:hypothetical protein